MTFEQLFETFKKHYNNWCHCLDYSFLGEIIESLNYLGNYPRYSGTNIFAFKINHIRYGLCLD